MKIETKYDFCNVSLIPRVVSEISSRDEISTSFCLGSKVLSVPIIGTPMKDVCDKDFCKKLVNLGCYGILHRFSSVEEQVSGLRDNIFAGAAIGINGDYIERFKALVACGCNVFCIDIANGANTSVVRVIDEFLSVNSNVNFIVGNVASAECFSWSAKLPKVVGVRVGIAGGSACSTKNATGVYHPMASLIMECKQQKNEEQLKAAIIADGGIREPQDFCKAIALGADCVMMGSVLSAASDSPAELIKQNGIFYKMYHGSASFEIQKLYRDKPKYIEGKTVLLDFNNETVEQIVQKFSDGLRSSMSYFNSKDIKSYQENVTWCYQ